MLASIGSAAEKHSGYDDASPETRAMQDDDASNPGFLWVQQGEALWSERAGPSIAVARIATVPRPLDARRGGALPHIRCRLGRPITLTQRIDQCRIERQARRRCHRRATRCSACPPMSGCNRAACRCRSSIDGPARPFFEAGKALFTTRQGQLNLSCSQCHDGLAGQRLGGSVIPQGHPNGYPEYRLEWQGMGSLDRRIRNCMVGVRAEPFAADSEELTNLELYLGWRSNLLKVETPAVRP